MTESTAPGPAEEPRESLNILILKGDTLAQRRLFKDFLSPLNSPGGLKVGPYDGYTEAQLDASYSEPFASIDRTLIRKYEV